MLIGACFRNRELFIITEFVELGNLFDMLHKQKKKLDWKTRMSMAKDIACGIHYLHSLPNPIIHR